MAAGSHCVRKVFNVESFVEVFRRHYFCMQLVAFNESWMQCVGPPFKEVLA